MRYVVLMAMVATLSFACSGEQSEEVAAEEVQEVQKTEVAASTFSPETLREELESFKNNRDKLAFLRKVTVDDHRVRTEESSIIQEHGFNSAEHKHAQEVAAKTDIENLAKIDAFTEMFGAPEEGSVGKMQAEATASVVHHSTDLSAKKRYYKLLTDAYDGELVSGTLYTMYLSRWYEMEKGDRLTMEGRYTEEDEIRELRSQLGL